MSIAERPAEALREVRPPRRVAVVPVFNEEATVVAVLDELERLVDEIIVVDDGSVDRSRELILEWSLNRKNIYPILFDRNQGLSAAYYAAFRDVGARLKFGQLQPDDLIITVDADGQHDPADLDRLVARVTDDGYDAAVARRDLSGYSPLKRTGNNLLSLWSSLWAGTRLFDVESGFRVFKAGPLVDALRFYKGYRYSETVEVAVVLPRLGYRLSNDVLVPVPVQRSRTSIRDGVIDSLAMVGAWWRVFAGRWKPADMPAWSVYVVPLLAIIAILFAAGDILRTSLFLGADSMISYTHTWYLSDQIFHHGTFPMHVASLDSGEAIMFPYAIAPYVLGALIFPAFGSWSVSLLMVLAVGGTVWAAGLARPVMRDPWLILLFVLNPFFIDTIFAFQYATVWCAFFFFLFVWSFERRRLIAAAALLWLCVSSQPVIGAVAIAGYGAYSLIRARSSLRDLALVGVPAGIALIPIFWMTSQTQSLGEAGVGTWLHNTGSSILSRSTFLAAPFLLTAAAPWLRRNYRLALVPALAATVAGIVLLGGFIRYQHAPAGYFGVVHASSDVYAEYFASPQFQPGAHYRVLEPSEREDGMYRFVRHGAVLSNEFFTESTFHRWWSQEQYGCYTSFKGVDFVVVEQAWEDRLHTNEEPLLQELVAGGDARVSYADPGGRFTVYDIRPFVSRQQKPESLSQCPL
jgi:glycosyltransferase involved in cell wall biosynthesis